MVLGLSVFILIIAFLMTRNNEPLNSEEVSEEVKTQTVTAVTSQELAFENTFTQLGTVISDSTAKITSNGSGRVTTVNFKQNDTVQAGAVIATLDNRTERLALNDARSALQAARSATSDVNSSVEQAETAYRQAKRDVISSLQTNLSTRQQIVTAKIDPLYARPNSNQPGVRIGTGVEVQTLIQFRIEENSVLQDLQTALTSVSVDSAGTEIEAIALEFDQSFLKFERYIDTIISTYQNIRNRDRSKQDLADSQIISFTETKSSIISLRGGINSRISALEQARIALTQAQNNQLSNQDSRLSTDIARAESAVRNAEIRLEDTVIRAPIAGDISSLNVTLGQVLSPGMELGTIINESNTSIEAFVTPAQRSSIAVGQTVTINESLGTITRIASTVDDTSGRVRVTIDPNERVFSVGETVRITFTPQLDTTSSSVTIPLTAVVFTGTAGSVFVLNDDSTVRTQAINIVSIQGRNVVAENTFNEDTLIVTDARGLSEGQLVTLE